MVWSLPITINEDEDPEADEESKEKAKEAREKAKKAKALAESAIEAIKTSISEEKRIIEEITLKLDLKKLLHLAEISADIGFQAQSISHAISSIQFNLRPRRRSLPKAAKLKLIRLARRISDEALRDQVLSIAAKLHFIKKADVAISDKLEHARNVISKMSRRNRYHQSVFHILVEELSKSAKKNPLFHDFKFEIFTAIRKSSDRNHDEAFTLYLELKPEGKIF